MINEKKDGIISKDLDHVIVKMIEEGENMNKILIVVLCCVFILYSNISMAKTTYEMTFFTSSSCHWCDRFEKEILNDPDVINALKDVTIYKLDVTDHKAQENGVRVTPYLLFSKNGKKIGHIIGYVDKTEFLRQLELILI
jgi:thioredoxin-related protein